MPLLLKRPTFGRPLPISLKILATLTLWGLFSMLHASRAAAQKTGLPVVLFSSLIPLGSGARAANDFDALAQSFQTGDRLSLHPGGDTTENRMIDLIRNLAGARQDVQQNTVLFSCVLRF